MRAGGCCRWFVPPRIAEDGGVRGREGAVGRRYAKATELPRADAAVGSHEPSNEQRAADSLRRERHGGERECARGGAVVGSYPPGSPKMAEFAVEKALSGEGTPRPP